jgi:hypothetical protein
MEATAVTAAARPPRGHATCSCCEGNGSHKDGSECTACQGLGHRPQTETEHCPGRPPLRRRHWRQPHAAWTPDRGIFGPTTGMDSRLFDEHGELRPEVRGAIMEKLDQALRVDGGATGSDWQDWTRVYLAGGSASEWAGERPNETAQDLDILIGVDYKEARGTSFPGMDPEEITTSLNATLRAQFNDTGVYFRVDSHSWEDRQHSLPSRSGSSSADMNSQISPSSTWPGSSLSATTSSEVAYAESVSSQIRHDAARTQRVMTSAEESGSAENAEAPGRSSQKFSAAGSAGIAPRNTSGTITSNGLSGSQPRSTIAPSLSREAVALSVEERSRILTELSLLTTTTDAAPAGRHVAGVSGDFSATAAIEDLDVSGKSTSPPPWIISSERPSDSSSYHWIGPFDLTAYVNPRAWSIEVLKPYAAYDLTDMRWAVKPPHLPGHSAADFDQGVLSEARAITSWARAILKIADPAVQHREALGLWDFIHRARDRAFSAEGDGWQDPGNLVEKWLAYSKGGLLDKIRELAYAGKTARLDTRILDTIVAMGAARDSYVVYHGAHHDDIPSILAGGLERRGDEPTVTDSRDGASLYGHLRDWTSPKVVEIHVPRHQAAQYLTEGHPAGGIEGTVHALRADLPPSFIRTVHEAAAGSDGDRFVTCSKGHEHWGAHGAAGLLLRHRDGEGPVRYLLQKRSADVDHAGQWSIPSGARGKDETPEQGAEREFREEMGRLPAGSKHSHTVVSTSCGPAVYSGHGGIDPRCPLHGYSSRKGSGSRQGSLADGATFLDDAPPGPSHAGGLPRSYDRTGGTPALPPHSTHTASRSARSTDDDRLGSASAAMRGNDLGYSRTSPGPFSTGTDGMSGSGTRSAARLPSSPTGTGTLIEAASAGTSGIPRREAAEDRSPESGASQSPPPARIAYIGSRSSSPGTGSTHSAEDPDYSGCTCSKSSRTNSIWQFHTAVYDAPSTKLPRGHGETEHEVHGSGWFTPHEIKGLPLHPAFAKSWDTVRRSKGPVTAAASQRFYHATYDELQPGDKISGGMAGGKYPRGEGWRGKRVWMATSPEHAEEWSSGGANVYEVRPHHPKQHTDLTDFDYDASVSAGAAFNQWHAPSAEVVRRLDGSQHTAVVMDSDGVREWLDGPTEVESDEPASSETTAGLGSSEAASDTTVCIVLDVPPELIHNVDESVDYAPHVTVVYCGKSLDEDGFEEVLRRAEDAARRQPGPLMGTLSGLDTFEPSKSSDGKVPVIVPANIPGIHVLRDRLEDLSASEHKGYIPHVTLAYCEPGEELPPPHHTVPITFTHLTVRRGHHESHRFPFGGTNE